MFCRTVFAIDECSTRILERMRKVRKNVADSEMEEMVKRRKTVERKPKIDTLTTLLGTPSACKSFPTTLSTRSSAFPSNVFSLTQHKQNDGLSIRELERRKTSILQGLTEHQKQAVLVPADKNLMVLACAGAGKTGVLTRRMVNLLHRQSPPSRHGKSVKKLLALTFTRKAANELSQRIAKMIPRSMLGNYHVATFHQFSLQMLRKYAKGTTVLGFELRNDSLRVIGETEQYKVVKTCMSKLETELVSQNSNIKDGEEMLELGKDYLDFSAEAEETYGGAQPSKEVVQFLQVLSCFKNGTYPWDQVVDKALVLEYQKELRYRGVVDMDDLVPSFLRLLQNNHHVLKSIESEYDALFVDEFQDVSKAEWLLLKILAQSMHLTVFLDDDQSIYGWRGSKQNVARSFMKTYKDHRKIVLSQNFRSSGNIVTLAKTLIEHNKEKRLEKTIFTLNKDGKEVELLSCRSEHAEITKLANLLLERNSLGHSTCVLARTRRILLHAQLVLRQFKVYSTLVPRSNEETNPYKMPAMKKLMERFFSAYRATQHWTDPTIKVDHHFSDFVANLIQTQRQGGTNPDPKGIYFDDRDHHAINLVALDAENFATIKEFSAAVELAKKNRFGAPIPADKVCDVCVVTLSTIHQAKGLEWDAVYLIRFNQGVLPSMKGDLCEERRLSYVAFTRARHYLLLSFIQDGRLLPSPFLDEIFANKQDHTNTSSHPVNEFKFKLIQQ